jgi:hypothetical protein
MEIKPEDLNENQSAAAGGGVLDCLLLGHKWELVNVCHDNKQHIDKF